MENKGQFYLLAAIVLIGIIFGFVIVSNSLKKSEGTRLYNLGDELNLESVKVLDYGTIKKDDITITIRDESGAILEENNQIINHFTAIYNQYAGEDKEIIFIFGEGINVFAYKYESTSTGSISINTGGGTTGINILNRIKENLQTTKTDNKIKVIADNKEYEFDLKKGENFYFIISQEVGGDKVVVTNK